MSVGETVGVAVVGTGCGEHKRQMIQSFGDESIMCCEKFSEIKRLFLAPSARPSAAPTARASETPSE
jgi:hypothetical protein